MRQENTARLTLASAMALGLCIAAWAGANEPSAPSAADAHAAHNMMMSSPKTTVTHAEYRVPDVDLVDSMGNVANLQDVFSADKPLVVNFIFTTCTTICPVLTATNLQLQKQLVDDATKPQYVSISIDPDYDSFSVMRSYAEQYGADWTFLTGTPDAVMTTLHAFDAYRGNKVNHFALILMRSAGNDQWTRVEGLTSAQDLAHIWRSNAL